MSTPDKPDDKLPIRFEVDARDKQNRVSSAPPKPAHGPRSPRRAAWIAEINERVPHHHVDWERQSDKYIGDYLDEIRHARLRLDEIATVSRTDASTPKPADDSPRARLIEPLPGSLAARESDAERAQHSWKRPLTGQLSRRPKGK
ncbi:hypothetical protein BH11MYX3_BH11MYX3_04690 [soil metagenome]